jgi:hypothetical protein
MSPMSSGQSQCQVPSLRSNSAISSTASSLRPRHTTPERVTSTGDRIACSTRSPSVGRCTDSDRSSRLSTQHRKSISQRVSMKSGAFPNACCFPGTPYLYRLSLRRVVATFGRLAYANASLTPACRARNRSPTSDSSIPYTVAGGGNGYVSANDRAYDFRKLPYGTWICSAITFRFLVRLVLPPQSSRQAWRS